MEIGNRKSAIDWLWRKDSNLRMAAGGLIKIIPQFAIRNPQFFVGRGGQNRTVTTSSQDSDAALHHTPKMFMNELDGGGIFVKGS